MKEPIKLSDFKPIGLLNIFAILLMIVTGYREAILAVTKPWHYVFVVLCFLVGVLNVWVLIRGVHLQRDIRVLDGQIEGHKKKLEELMKEAK